MALSAFYGNLGKGPYYRDRRIGRSYHVVTKFILAPFSEVPDELPQIYHEIQQSLTIE